MQHTRLDERLDKDPIPRIVEETAKRVTERLTDGSWGERMKAYRQDVGLTQAEVVEILNEVHVLSEMTLARIEERPKPPTQRRTQLTAVLALIVYGIHPSVMSLSLDVLPPGLTLTRMEKAVERMRRARTAESRWILESMCPDPVATGVA